ncbi:hypothetical protein EDD86DRAFT_90163 [Gorgonomyces haynaldii]|nr:hypothetical protein EDD86DRAFT_90163 [Gorgonomyces haynaldii]
MITKGERLVFEILTVQKMEGLLEPSFSFLLNGFVQRMPRFYVLSKYRIILFGLLKFGIEQFFLRVYHSSMAEHVYYLKRTGTNLYLKSIGQLVFLEMLYTLMNDYYEQYAQDGLLQSFYQSNRWRSLVVKWYPRLKQLYQSLDLAFIISYTLEISSHCSLLFYLLNIRIKRLDPTDLQQQSWIMKHIVPLSLLAYRFLEWFDANQKSKEPIPPPPAKIGNYSSKRCFLCQKQRTNPATIPSGYLFCYQCIHQHLSEHFKCPITLESFTTDDIRKVYY